MSIISRNAALAAITVTIAGCQTVGGGGLDTPDALLAKHILDTHCVISTSKGGGRSTESPVNKSRSHVYSVTERPNGWLAADISSPSPRGRAFRGNIYFNKMTAEYACGTDNWRAGNDPSSSVGFYKTDLITPKPSTTKRSIAVSWEGYADLFSGVIEETGNGQGGNVQIILPNNEGDCTGRYDATSKTRGSWSVSCTNDLAASGTFTAYGKGKGASGNGTDARGRMVSYTVGGTL